MSFTNPPAATYTLPPQNLSPILTFHKTLPDYNTTLLHHLPDVAEELGVGHVFLKDESTRFGLPAFKILGASWAVYRALVKDLGLGEDAGLDELKRVIEYRKSKDSQEEVKLVTCSAGNWGRAVARMGKILGVKSVVYVDKGCHEFTRGVIEGEGAVVKVVDGTYEDAVAEARREGEGGAGGLLVMDTSWEGYEEVPTWVTEGYSSMLLEVDQQLREQIGRPATTALASCGVGSWLQAVVLHYKSKKPTATVVSVEPDTAACLKTSLERKENTPVQTRDSIMNGVNCGLVSHVAWPYLRDGVDVAVTVTDQESHHAVLYLGDQGVDAGPCGAATLAALRKFCKNGTLKLGTDDVVVLISTEGNRPYPVPA